MHNKRAGSGCMKTQGFCVQTFSSLDAVHELAFDVHVARPRGWRGPGLVEM